MSDVVAINDGPDLAGVVADPGLSSAEGDQRRIKDRVPISTKFQIIPVSKTGKLLRNDQFLGFGKDISTTGIALSHLAPMVHRKAVLIAMNSTSPRFAVEAEVIWTRPADGELFETGFQHVRKLVGHQLLSTS